MLFEIRKHWSKLKKISGLTDLQLQTALDKMLIKLTFIREEIIPVKIWKNSEKLATDIDLDDTAFIALTIYLKGNLWTGDKRLYTGLKAKKFKTIYITTDMIELRDKLAQQ